MEEHETESSRAKLCHFNVMEMSPSLLCEPAEVHQPLFVPKTQLMQCDRIARTTAWRIYPCLWAACRVGIIEKQSPR